MFGSSKTPSELPTLTDHPAYRDVLDRHARLSAELDSVTRERDAVSAALAAEFGTRVGVPTDSDLEALELAGGSSEQAVRHRSQATRLRDLTARAVVLGKAVALLDAEVVKAKRAAQNALAPVAFKTAFGPAIRDAGEKLLVAAKALRDLRKLQTLIDYADLLTGPNASMPLPVQLLEKQLDPSELITSLVDCGSVSAQDAAELRKKYAAA